MAAISRTFFQPRSQRTGTVDLRGTAHTEALFDFHAELLQIESERLQNFDGDTLVECQNTQQQVFCADMIVVQAFCLAVGKQQDLPPPRSQISENIVI